MNDTTPEDERASAAIEDQSAQKPTPIATRTRVPTETDERDLIVTRTRAPSGSGSGPLGPPSG